ncbi:hypothetical protein MHBO_000484 [Bonamia ostreae]|uniref:Uncharacterized protein n=1 Tax=Bonamia ostreae TaxID=126728 RepID=A0ABV2AFS3_9EUKA
MICSINGVVLPSFEFDLQAYVRRCEQRNEPFIRLSQTYYDEMKAIQEGFPKQISTLMEDDISQIKANRQNFAMAFDKFTKAEKKGSEAVKEEAKEKVEKELEKFEKNIEKLMETLSFLIFVCDQ